MRKHFEDIYKGIDQTDELLSLKIEAGNPKLLVHKDGRRWKPLGYVDTKSEFDPYSLKRRFIELMKQAIYQTRNKMVIMQLYRKKYRTISVYKMGFLMSKTDTASRNFYRFALKTLQACTITRIENTKEYHLYDLLEVHERLLNLWFELDLLTDLVVINNRNCERMLDRVISNRKHAWKFVN